MAKAAAAKEVVVVVVVMNLFVLQQGCPSSRPTATSDGRRGRGGTRGQSQGNAAFLSSFHVKLVSLTFYRFRLLLQRANKKPQERSKRPPRSFPNHPPLSNSVTCRLAETHLSLTTSRTGDEDDDNILLFFADSQLHIGGKELDHHFPTAHRLDLQLPGQRQHGQQERLRKLSRVVDDMHEKNNQEASSVVRQMCQP